MSRLSGYRIQKARERCIERDGEGCRMQGKDEFPCRGNIVLDHIDGNPENNPPDGSNWQLLCRGHNARKARRVRESRAKFASHLRIKHSLVRSTEAEKASRRELYGIRGISAELKKSEEIRPRIEEWIIQTVERDGKLELSEALNSGAYLGKCNQGTVKKYIDALTSRIGPLHLDEVDGVEYLVLKKPE